MKRWKWILALAGAPALLISLLWTDSYFRAVDAIRAEDERLTKDIATFRASLRPRVAVDSSLSPEALRRLPCPGEVFLTKPPIELEDGKEGEERRGLQLLIDHVMRNSSSPRFNVAGEPEPVLTIEESLQALTVTEHTFGWCGYPGARTATQFEEDALTPLSRPLTRTDLRPTPAELRRLADGLDRLLVSRRTVVETLEAEYLLNRVEVLRVIHPKANPTKILRRPPGWRDFFSWRVHIVKALKELDGDYQQARKDIETFKLEPPVPLEREGPVSVQRRTWSEITNGIEGILRRDRQVLARWHLARLATAVARYHLDHSREPGNLKDLVPDYLPTIPANPVGDEPFQYLDGVLKAPSIGGGSGITWDTRRR